MFIEEGFGKFYIDIGSIEFNSGLFQNFIFLTCHDPNRLNDGEFGFLPFFQIQHNVFFGSLDAGNGIVYGLNDHSGSTGLQVVSVATLDHFLGQITTNHHENLEFKIWPVSNLNDTQLWKLVSIVISHDSGNLIDTIQEILASVNEVKLFSLFCNKNIVFIVAIRYLVDMFFQIEHQEFGQSIKFLTNEILFIHWNQIYSQSLLFLLNLIFEGNNLFQTIVYLVINNFCNLVHIWDFLE